MEKVARNICLNFWENPEKLSEIRLPHKFAGPGD